MDKRDWWLVFYRPLSGPAVEVDFCRAVPGVRPDPIGEYVIREVAVLGKTFGEMVDLKQGAKIALDTCDRSYTTRDVERVVWI